MTNEEIQKTMEFILEHQAQFAVSIQRLQEERVRDQPRLIRLEESLIRLEESFQLLVQLAQNTDARFDTFESNTESRFSRLESNMVQLGSHMVALTAAQVHNEERLSALIDIVREERNGKS